MPQYDELTIRSGTGLVTNFSAVDIGKQAFRVLENAQTIKPGLITDFPGAGTARLLVGTSLISVPDLPSGFTFERGFVYHITQPSDTDVMVIFGSNGGRDRVYVWPDIVASNGLRNSASSVVNTTKGSRVSNTYIKWLELTEVELVTVDVVTDTQNFSFTSLENGSTADYYIGWYIVDWDQNDWDIVTDNDASGGITIKFGITGVANGHTCVLCRFPIFININSVSPYYQFDNVNGVPSFAQHGESLVIHTGSHEINDGPDLWLGYINRDYFNDDTDLKYNSWHCDHSLPFKLENDQEVHNGSPSNVAESDDPVPDPDQTYWILDYALLYDDREESNVYFDLNDDQSYNQPYISDRALAYVSGNLIRATISLAVFDGFNKKSPYVAGGGRPPVMSRRVSKLSVYLSAGGLSQGFYTPRTSFFLVREIDINDSNWSIVSGKFEFTLDIYGTDWRQGQQLPFSRVNGYDMAKIGANARFEVNAGNRSIIGPIYDDSEKNYRALFSPQGPFGENKPDVFPVTNRIDVSHYGIYSIVGMAEQFGRVVIFGNNTSVVVSMTGENAGEILEQFQKMDLIAQRTLDNIDGFLYFSSKKHMLEIFDGNRVAEPAPGWLLQDIWDDFATDEKQEAFAGYHENDKEWWIAVGDTQRIFIWSVRDQNWKEYVSSNTYVDFIEGANGELFGATSSSILRLKAPTPTESLAITIRPQVFNHSRRSYRTARMSYKSNVTIKLTPLNDEYETETLKAKTPVLFLPQSDFNPVDRDIGLDTERASFELTTSASTSAGLSIDEITLAGNPKREK
jgi:hypothetical protein